MKIQIISVDTNLVDIIYNQIPARYATARLRKIDVRTIALDYEGGFVDIVFTDGTVINLNWQYIESVEGDENITTNQDLYDKLKAMM